MERERERDQRERERKGQKGRDMKREVSGRTSIEEGKEKVALVGGWPRSPLALCTHPLTSAAPGNVPSFGHPIASSWSPYCA